MYVWSDSRIPIVPGILNSGESLTARGHISPSDTISSHKKTNMNGYRFAPKSLKNTKLFFIGTADEPTSSQTYSMKTAVAVFIRTSHVPWRVHKYTMKTVYRRIFIRRNPARHPTWVTT